MAFEDRGANLGAPKQEGHDHAEGYGLYWWIPLPDPIGLPSEEVVRFTIRHDFGDYLELLDSNDQNSAASGGPWPEKYVISLIVRQLDKPWRDPWDLTAILDLAREMATDRSADAKESMSGSNGKK